VSASAAARAPITSVAAQRIGAPIPGRGVPPTQQPPPLAPVPLRTQSGESPSVRERGGAPGVLMAPRGGGQPSTLLPEP